MDCLNTSLKFTQLFPSCEQQNKTLNDQLKHFEQLAEEDSTSIDSLRIYNNARKRIITAILNTDFSKVEQSEGIMNLLAARKSLVRGICAASNPEVDMTGFTGIHEEMCIIAFVTFLKEEGIRSSDWSATSIDQLISCCQDLLDNAFELRSCALKGVQEEDVLSSVIGGRLASTMRTVKGWKAGNYMLLPGGWCGEDITGHFFFVMVSKCHKAAHYSLKLFDTQPNPNRGAEQIEAGRWRITLYTEREVNQRELRLFIGQVFRCHTFKIPDATLGDKLCEIVYYPQGKSLSISTDSSVIGEENDCVADSLQAFLNYWESCERTQCPAGKPLFPCFQRYLWERFHNDISDANVYRSLLSAMKKI